MPITNPRLRAELANSGFLGNSVGPELGGVNTQQQQVQQPAVQQIRTTPVNLGSVPQISPVQPVPVSLGTNQGLGTRQDPGVIEQILAPIQRIPGAIAEEFNAGINMMTAPSADIPVPGANAFVPVLGGVTALSSPITGIVNALGVEPIAESLSSSTPLSEQDARLATDLSAMVAGALIPGGGSRLAQAPRLLKELQKRLKTF